MAGARSRSWSGDRNTGDLKALAGREWDVCIDNPTTLPFWVRDAGQVLKGKVKHYVFVSTLSVYASDKRRRARTRRRPSRPTRARTR